MGLLGGVECVRGALFLVLLPLYLHQRGCAMSSVGLVVSGQYLGDILGKIVNGYLLDRFRAAPTAASGLLLAALSLVFLSLTGKTATSVAAALAFGAGAAVTWPLAFRAAAGCAHPEKSGTAVASVFASWMGGAALGVLLAPLLPEALTPICERTAALLLFAAAATLGVRGMLVPTPDTTGGRDWRGLGPFFIALRRIKVAMGMAVLQAFALGLVLPLLAAFATSELAVTGATYSFMLLVGGGTGLAAVLVAGYLAHRVHPARIFLAGLLLTGGALLALAFRPDRPQICLLAALLGAGCGFAIPAWNVFLIGATPAANLGLSVSGAAGLEDAAFAAGPWLAGWLWSAAGPAAPLYLAAAILFLAFFAGVVYLPRLTVPRRDDTPPEPSIRRALRYRLCRPRGRDRMKNLYGLSPRISHCRRIDSHFNYDVAVTVTEKGSVGPDRCGWQFSRQNTERVTCRQPGQ